MRVAIRALICGMALAGSAAMAEPRHEATITRTTYGIPHIVAKDWGGIGYGVAYAYAEDNLCLLAERFVTVAGERSLHFGGPEEKSGPGTPMWANIDSDVAHRAVLDVASLRAGWDQQSPEAQALIEGYVAGYNRFLRDAGTEGIPVDCRGKPWVRPIMLEDMLRHLEAQMLQGGLLATGEAIARAQPPALASETAAQAAVRLNADWAANFPVPVKPELGSNGWAFGGEASADGRGLLIGNPHFPWVGPNRFWQMHATIPGKYDAMGVGLAGAPLPFLGFNRDVAWTHTVTQARHITLFALALDPSGPTRYMVDGESLAMEQRDIAIPMPDGAPPVVRKAYSTRFGPVVSLPGTPFVWTRESGFAIRDANQMNQRAIETWMRIGSAHSVREIADAVADTLGIPWVNTIAADRHGDALHADITAVPNVSAAKIEHCAAPLTRLVAARVTLLDGTRAQCDWDIAAGTPAPGLMPAANQASTIRRDYLTNSNDSYWLSNPRAPHAELSPILGEHATARSLRTRSNFIETEALLAAGKINHARAQALVLGNRSLAANMALDTVLALCAAREALADGCAALAQWDRRFDVDSRGAYLFARFWNRTAKLPGLWQVPFDVAEPLSTPRDLVDAGGTADKLLETLAATMAELEADGIALDARWGDVQAVRLAGETIPVHGGPGEAGVLNLQSLDAAVKEQGGIKPIHGSSYIQIVGFDEVGPVADAILAYSQSTDPASRHFADQTRLYSQKRWHRLPFTPREVAAQAIAAPKRIAE